jgi:L-fuconolactonase
VLDPHVHVWHADDPEPFPLRQKIPALQRDFTLSELRREVEACGVSGVLLLQAVDHVDESLRLLELARDDTMVQGVICWADPAAPDFDQLLHTYSKYPKFVGLRPMPADTFGTAWLQQETTARALDCLRKIDKAVDFLVPVDQLARLRGVLREHRDVKGVLNHAGRPAVMAGITAAWRDEMCRLAAETDVVVKCSGLVERAGFEWTFDQLAPWVAHLLETFGPGRMMFASNWPMLTLACHYGAWLQGLVALLQRLGVDEAGLGRILCGTASRIYQPVGVH